VVEALVGTLGEASLDVVVGAAAPSLARLRAIAAADPRVVLHVDAQDMPALTAAADFAIGAGGSSSWERCCLGLPSITLVLADNQRANALALEAAGATLALEAGAADFGDTLRAAVGSLVQDGDRRQAMSRAAAALCDGAGADRVAERLLTLVKR
jgi:spore coat polysaccharide biosynthesis predicted glycosyltransferase SpsG